MFYNCNVGFRSKTGNKYWVSKFVVNFKLLKKFNPITPSKKERGIAAQLGAASSRQGGSGRKRLWHPNLPEFARVVTVEPIAAPVRLDVFGMALDRCPARAANARAVQELFAAHRNWGPLRVAFRLVHAFDGDVLVAQQAHTKMD